MNWSRCETQPTNADSRLEALLIEGLTTGKDIPLSPDFWTELGQEAAILAIRAGDSGIPAQFLPRTAQRPAPEQAGSLPGFLRPKGS